MSNLLQIKPAAAKPAADPAPSPADDPAPSSSSSSSSQFKPNLKVITPATLYLSLYEKDQFQSVDKFVSLDAAVFYSNLPQPLHQSDLRSAEPLDPHSVPPKNGYLSDLMLLFLAQCCLNKFNNPYVAIIDPRSITTLVNNVDGIWGLTDRPLKKMREKFSYWATKQMVLAPLNVNGNHWVLGVFIISPGSNQSYPLIKSVDCGIIDSIGQTASSKTLSQLRSIHKLLGVSGDHSILVHDAPSSPSEFPVRCPAAQPNGYDCGVYVLISIRAICERYTHEKRWLEKQDGNFLGVAMYLQTSFKERYSQLVGMGLSEADRFRLYFSKELKPIIDRCAADDSGEFTGELRFPPPPAASPPTPEPPIRSSSQPSTPASNAKPTQSSRQLEFKKPEPKLSPTPEDFDAALAGLDVEAAINSAKLSGQLSSSISPSSISPPIFPFILPIPPQEINVRIGNFHEERVMSDVKAKVAPKEEVVAAAAAAADAAGAAPRSVNPIPLSLFRPISSHHQSHIPGPSSSPPPLQIPLHISSALGIDSSSIPPSSLHTPSSSSASIAIGKISRVTHNKTTKNIANIGRQSSGKGKGEGEGKEEEEAAGKSNKKRKGGKKRKKEEGDGNEEEGDGDGGGGGGGGGDGSGGGGGKGSLAQQESNKCSELYKSAKKLWDKHQIAVIFALKPMAERVSVDPPAIRFRCVPNQKSGLPVHLDEGCEIERAEDACANSLNLFTQKYAEVSGVAKAQQEAQVAIEKVKAEAEAKLQEQEAKLQAKIAELESQLELQKKGGGGAGGTGAGV